MKNIIVALAILSLALLQTEAVLTSDLIFNNQECGVCSVSLTVANSISSEATPFLKQDDWVGIRCDEINSFGDDPMEGSIGIIAMGIINDENEADNQEFETFFMGTYKNKNVHGKSYMAADYDLRPIFDVSMTSTSISYNSVSFWNIAVEGVYDDWHLGVGNFKCIPYHEAEMPDISSFGQKGWKNEDSVEISSHEFSTCARHTEVHYEDPRYNH